MLNKLITGLSVIFIFSCTATTTEKTIDITEKSGDPPIEIPNEKCHTFQSIPGGQSLIDDYVLYRDFLSEGDFETAYSYWKNVYERTPAADGRRWNVFTDGVRFYEWKISLEESEEKKTEYKEKILSFYSDMGHCYPEQLNFSLGLAAFDLYYKYRGFRDDVYVYHLFREAFLGFGEEVPPFIINPFTALLVQLVIDKEIEEENVAELATQILERVNANKDDAPWGVVITYTPQRLADLERIRGFYSCDYYLENYIPLFESSPEDCPTIQLVLSRLLWGECSNDLEILKVLNAAADKHCISPVTATSLVRDAYQALRDGRYSESIRNFRQAIVEEGDLERKANYALIIGKIYYSHLRDFPKSREFALQASSFRPNWGEPYILIGKLYASSGPLCGPGRGWDSQVVTWVAIDEWEKARSKDRNTAAEATQLINQYTQYMPSREDIFSRTLNVGDTYFVPCWIQRNTTIRIRP
jgi:tetratricopeptide (TPR) repeat protein